MPAKSIETLLEEIALARPSNHAIALVLRELVREKAPEAVEAVKYGGLHYIRSAPVCGIFSYAGHVSLEFSRGAEFDDGGLLGDGQYRRHLKFTTPEEIDAAKVGAYIAQAYERS